jgi:putative membrane protein
MNPVYMLPVVALLGAAACGGLNQNQEPMTPAAGQPQASPAPAPAPTTTEPATPPPSGMNEPAPPSDVGGTAPGMGPGAAQPPSSGAIGQGGQQPGVGGGATADQGAMTDAQIVAVADTINRGQEKEAVLAAAKAKDGKVKAFALMMATGHRDANRRMMNAVRKANITPQASSLSTQLDSDVSQMLDNLRNKIGAELDKAYLEDQVKLHTQALDLIDNRLLPNAKDATLKSELQQLRASIAEHLRRAQDIQSSLGSSRTNEQPSGAQPPQGGSQGGSQPYPKR